MKSLSVALITLNEEKNLKACLQSVPFASEIVIVDSFSTDKTREIALSFKAKFISRVFEDYASQKNFAMAQCSGDWILLLDADERVNPELAIEIKKILEGRGGFETRPYAGFWMKRLNFIFGGPMRFGNSRNDKQLRLIKRGAGQFEGLVHERLKVQGQVGELAGQIEHYSTQTMEDYFRRFDKYTSLEVRQMAAEGKKANGLMIYLRPLAEFFYYYIFCLGFLDGFRGLKYQVLSSYYTYTKLAKLRKNLL